MADPETESKALNQDELVADIDRTRAELASTIDAIADRVSPKKNVDRVKEELSGRVKEEISERVSQIDPIMAGAAALAVVVGVTILFLLRRRKRR